MYSLDDLYTQELYFKLEDGSDLIGQTNVKFQVRRYEKLTSLGNEPRYQVKATIRVMIPNSRPPQIGPCNTPDYSEYPAALTVTPVLGTTANPVSAELVQYCPKTINASVTATHTASDSSGATVTHERSAGSISSQSNSYGASVSLGFFGDVPTGGVSADYQHSSSHGQSRASSHGTDNTHSHDQSGSETMSVKDWACNSSINPSNQSPVWTWAQEYPWNTVKFNATGVSNPSTGTAIELPLFVQSLLAGSNYAFPLPPSDLSLFGLDFTMTALWLAQPDSDGSIPFSISLDYVTASHSYDGAQSATASLSQATPFPLSGVIKDIAALALDPIGLEGRQGSVIGFLPVNFETVPQLSGKGKFEIVSATNNLLIRDTTDYPGNLSTNTTAGFSTDQDGLIGTFTSDLKTLEMTALFKVIDKNHDYAINLKHWKVGDGDIVLTLTVNGNSAEKLVKTVSAKRSEGGEGNFLSISLRDLDFGSLDSHDLLKMGLNTVVISLSPADASPLPCSYQVRALSISRS